MPRECPQQLPGCHTALSGRVLVNGDGQIAPLPLPLTGSLASAAGVSAPAGRPANSPFVINVTYGASVANAPAGFVPGVQAAVQYLEGQFTNAVTVNVTIGFGEVAGAPMAAGALGTTLTYLTRVTYSDLASAVALPGANPIPSANYWLTTANAKAAGLAGPNSDADGYIGFANTQPFDYARDDGITPGSYDFFAIAMHELTEVMGRAMLTGKTIGTTPNSYELMDLFQYAAPGIRDFSAAGPGYFSPDDGRTNLGSFNTIAGGDAGDWAATMGNDAFNAFSAPGVINAVSPTDLAVLEKIGWDLNEPATTGDTGSVGLGITGKAHTSAMESNGSLTPGTVVATIALLGGSPNATYSYKLNGGTSGQFVVSTLDNTVSLIVGPAGAPGATNGAVTPLDIVATDNAQPTHVAISRVAVIVGTNGTDVINLATHLGSEPAPAFIYGLAGNDTLNATGIATALWFAGGAGADRLTGGSGSDTYQFGAASDSTIRTMDIITNFDASADLLDFTALGTSLRMLGPISGSKLPSGSIGWRTVGADTFVYVNTSARTERLTVTDMKIDLQGSIILDRENILHL